MDYHIELKRRALKDLRALDPMHRQRVFDGISRLRNDLQGDVKRLTNFTPEYRLRVGDYRVLFEVADAAVTIYRVKHRRDAYS